MERKETEEVSEKIKEKQLNITNYSYSLETTVTK